MPCNPFKLFAHRRLRARRLTPSARLSLEQLETRVVLSSGPLGANIPAVSDQSLQNVFVDVMKQAEGFMQYANPTLPATVDANGWPTQDFQVILQDGGANLAHIYDGTYALSFTGQANLSSNLAYVTINGITTNAVTITNQVYNAATNTTTAAVTLNEVDANPNWAVNLVFSNTSGGVQNIKLIRPGYAPNTTQVFTNQFLATLQPFSSLRVMDFTQTNNNPVVNWSDRTQVTAPSQAIQWDAATQQYFAKGVAWEYVANLANVTGKDIWINIPEGATDAYVVQLATLLKDDLAPGIHVYVEYSNELWNYQFTQATANLNAALAEVQAGVISANPSPLAYPGETASASGYEWANRRVAERLVQISNDFASVWGSAAIDNQIRPVLASQIAGPYLLQEDLKFIEQTYGSPRQFLFGIAGAPYFNLEGRSNLTTTQQVLSALSASIQQQIALLPAYAHWATYYGLQDMAYEGGPDTSSGNNPNSSGPGNLAADSVALLDPGMEGLVEQYLEAWYANGGGLFSWFFAGPSDYHDASVSQYGDWGMTDDITNLNTPEYLGVEAVLAAPPPALADGTVIPGAIQAINYVYAENVGNEAGNPYPRYLNNGAILDYMIQAPQTGAYNLSINYAAVFAGEQLQILVNGQPAQTLTLPATGPDFDSLYAPNDFANSQPVALTLNAGLSVVRLKVVGLGLYGVSDTINQLMFTAGPPNTNQGPVVVTPATASPSPVTGASTGLSALGADPGGATSLTYTWSASGTPPTPVTFSANGTSAAQNTTATFSAAGIYTLLVTIKHTSGLTTASAVTVVVEQTLTGLNISPGAATVQDDFSQQLSVVGADQFGNAMSPGVTWSVSGAGSISSTGLYTAPTSGTAAVTITAASGSFQTSATVILTPPPTPPTVATPASASPGTVTGASTSLSVLGAGVALASNLTYTWSTTGTPPAPVTFSVNGSNAAQNTTATFSKAGTYSFLVTITDLSGLTTTSTVIVTVAQTLSGLTVLPGMAVVLNGGSQQFSVAGTDQFGNAMTPSVIWSVNGSGTIGTTGLYTASASGTPSVTIVATSGSFQSTATVTVVAPAANMPNYASGFTATDMMLNGSAALSGSRLRLTNGGGYEAASAFYKTPVNVSQFSTQFNFQLTNPNADGFAFVIQGIGSTALGNLGGDLGYAGIGMSMAIKFDLYGNAGAGNDATGLFTNGAHPYTSGIDLSSTGIDLHSGDVFNVGISYDGSTLTVTSTDTVTSASATQTYTVNLAALVGGTTAYVGFTGGTGGLTATQDILAWTYASVTPAANVLPAYPSGFTATGMTLNGNATLSGNRLRLTNGGSYEASSAFFTTPANVAQFSTQFTFQLSNASADGFAFVIQGNNPTALGGFGSDLGYAGIGNSMAIKFGLYNYASAGNDSTGLFTNGAHPYTSGIDLSSTGINLHSGNVFKVAVSYNGSTLTVTITDSVTNASATQIYSVNLPALVGDSTAYVGFTGGSGGLTAIQDILTWTYASVPTQGPTVATQANASPGTVTGTSTNLSVLGTDAGGAASLTYTWSTTGTPPAPVTFSANGSNAAQNTNATFSAAGAYSFLVTIQDGAGLTTTSSVTVNVVQTLTGLMISPGTATVLVGATQQFSVSGADQFGNAMTAAVTWSVNGAGSISSSGLYTTPATVTPSVIITATSGSVFGTASVTLTATPPPPNVPNFGSGFTATGMTLNGNATLSGNRLRLTNGGSYEASSAFFTTPVSVTQFSTQFTFQLTNANADGFAFVIQGNSPAALGGFGSDLGYAGIGNSVAIKFGLYNYAGGGSNSTGLFTNGAHPYTSAIDLSSTGIDLHSGDVFNVAITYDGSTLKVTITDTVTTASATQTYSVNLPALVGGSTAYVGFTGGTGGLTAIQDILAWTYSGL